VQVAVHANELGLTARELVKRLQDGEPSVHANHSRTRDGIVVFGPTCMKPGDAAVVVRRLRAELGSGHRPKQL
jgi:L-seryl-tRNA(Ser) seleniumtransferase